jgi:hypothetical protein
LPWGAKNEAQVLRLNVTASCLYGFLLLGRFAPSRGRVQPFVLFSGVRLGRRPAGLAPHRHNEHWMITWRTSLERRPVAARPSRPRRPGCGGEHPSPDGWGSGGALQKRSAAGPPASDRRRGRSIPTPETLRDNATGNLVCSKQQRATRSLGQLRRRELTPRRGLEAASPQRWRSPRWRARWAASSAVLSPPRWARVRAHGPAE